MDDRFLGSTTVCFVFKFCLFVPTNFLSLKGISQYQIQALKIFLKYVLKNRIKIYRKYHVDLKLEWSLCVKYQWSWKRLQMKVCSHSLMWLSKHCSGHYVTTQACTLIHWAVCICDCVAHWMITRYVQCRLASTVWANVLSGYCLLSYLLYQWSITNN